MNATDAAVLTAVIASVMSFATAWIGLRGTAANEARKQATAHAETFYARLVADNDRLSTENRQQASRVLELADEVSELHRRVGTYEADLARLGRENDALREETERLASLLTQEMAEKRHLLSLLRDEQREKAELIRRIVKLEATLASMAGVITTASTSDTESD